MYNVISQNQLVKAYDFSSLITVQDDAQACDIVKQIVAQGNYFTNSPKFQTKENIFARPEPVWLKYRMSFMFSVFMYLGREVKVSEMMAWSFMTNLQGAEDREKLWHNHWHPTNPDAKMLSGVFYIECDEKLDAISFTNFNGYGWSLKPKEYNIHNSSEYTIFVKKNENCVCNHQKKIKE
jgi:hypothetical protein